jgi:predicted restriction endonuclease
MSNYFKKKDPYEVLKKIKYKKIAAKSGKGFCDNLWAEIVKIRDENRCVICGKEKYLNAHHLISRKVFKFRWKIENGISLCPLHHNFSVELSAHTAPWGFEQWLKENRPNQYGQHCIDRKEIENIKIDYNQIYYELENRFKQITGSYFRIKRIEEYIMFVNADEINKNFIEDKYSFSKIALNHGVSEKSLKTFMDKNKMVIGK